MTDANTPTTIVVGMDYSELGDLALRRALDRVKDSASAEIHVVNVAHGYGPMVNVETGSGLETFDFAGAAEQLKTHVQQRLEIYKKEHDTSHLSRLVAHVRIGNAAQEVAQLAEDLQAELVVVGTHGRRGVKRLLLGSVAEGVVRAAPCSVMVVRERSEADEPKIEPACPNCIKARAESNGEQLWCGQHREKHGRPHTYHYSSRAWSVTRRSDIL